MSGFIIFILGSCRKDHFMVPPPPKVSKPTATLEASFVSTAPDKVSSAYWKTADYLKVDLRNVSTGFLFGDGLLNMTGLFGGINSFSGKDSGLVLKAAYDNDNIYILAEWYDSKINISDASWLWNGSVDVLKLSESNAGWTSQRNNDKLSFAFEIDNASSAFGSFSSVGCQASCHNIGVASSMNPTNGKVDIWNWTLAHSFPIGYAHDMIADQNGLVNDAGQQMFTRNNIGTTDRSGPEFEWDGTSQNITLPNGQEGILDPGFFLMNKTPFTGNIEHGDSLYHREILNQPGHCASCHGENGEGATEGAVNIISLNKKNRTTLIDNMNNAADMTNYWQPFTASEKNDIVAYLRGLAGVPGYIVTMPDGSSADIQAVSNVTPVDVKNAMLPSTNQHTKYQVMIIRKLNTNNVDDVQFEAVSGNTYQFGVAIMDNDSRNHVGSILETLTFK